jgi:arylsulfatase A-like enzyme/Tfp pilus assembly protein PilF
VFERATSFLIVVVLLGGCARREAPDVVLVTFDTTRYDHFGCTGDPEAHTPIVDGLAARGLVFEHAYASVALTLPSHATIMTGLEPIAHGVHENGRARVPDAVDTLAERLRAAGWDTAAFVSAFVLDHRFGLDQGFDTYGDETHRRGGALDLTVPSRPALEVTDAALSWVRERHADRPFFLWVHYYDPHLPRRVDPAFDGLRDRYAAAIASADVQLGRLLDGLTALGRTRGTLVVFTADHGEGLEQHGERSHGILAYDSTLHVPLVLAGPGVPVGRRADALARHVDIVPTVLGLVGLPVPRELPGRNLLRASSTDGVVGYFECWGPHLDYGWAVITGVRSVQWKYTAEPAPEELYDVLRDPGETTNRIEAEPAVRAEMRDRLAAVRRRYATATTARAEVLSLEERERLAALGYVEVPREHEPDTQLDPRRLASLHDWVDDARWLATAGRYDEAIDALETMAQSPSVRAFVLRTLAPVYAARGRYDDAVAAFDEYIRLTGSEEASLGLGRTLLGAGNPERALAVLAGAPGSSPATQLLRAHALARLGRHAEARAAVDAAFAGRRDEVARVRTRAALVIDAAPVPDGEAELRGLLAVAPNDAVLGSRLGFYLALWGRPDQHDEAHELLAAAARSAPGDADIQSNLGWGAARLGHDDEAVRALEAALHLDAQRSLERFRLAIVLHRTGDSARAAELVRTALAEEPQASWAGPAHALQREIEQERTSR